MKIKKTNKHRSNGPFVSDTVSEDTKITSSHTVGPPPSDLPPLDPRPTPPHGRHPSRILTHFGYQGVHPDRTQCSRVRRSVTTLPQPHLLHRGQSRAVVPGPNVDPMQGRPRPTCPRSLGTILLRHDVLYPQGSLRRVISTPVPGPSTPYPSQTGYVKPVQKVESPKRIDRPQKGESFPVTSLRLSSGHTHS